MRERKGAKMKGKGKKRRIGRLAVPMLKDLEIEDLKLCMMSLNLISDSEETCASRTSPCISAATYLPLNFSTAFQ